MIERRNRSSSATVSLRRVGRFLTEYRWWIVGAALAGYVVASAFFLVTGTTEYTVEATVEVPSGQQRRATGAVRFDTLLTSPDVLTAAREALASGRSEPWELSVTDLRRRLQVEREGNLVRVSLKASSPSSGREALGALYAAAVGKYGEFRVFDTVSLDSVANAVKAEINATRDSLRALVRQFPAWRGISYSDSLRRFVYTPSVTLSGEVARAVLAELDEGLEWFLLRRRLSLLRDSLLSTLQRQTRAGTIDTVQITQRRSSLSDSIRALLRRDAQNLSADDGVRIAQVLWRLSLWEDLLRTAKKEAATPRVVSEPTVVSVRSPDPFRRAIGWLLGGAIFAACAALLKEASATD